MNKRKALSLIKNTAAIIVLLALLIIIFYQNRDRDLFKFGNTASQSNTGDGENTNIFEGFTKGDVRAINDDVILLTSDTFAIMNTEGKGNISPMTLPDPVLHSEKEYIICYENKSKEAKVFKGTRECYTVNTENSIICAKVNRNGYAVVTSEKDGYNCEIVVYNRLGEPIFMWNLSESEFLDVDVSCDNKKIALSSVGAANEKMRGKVELIDITAAEVKKTVEFKGELFYSVDFNINGTYTAIGSDRLALFNSGGTLKWSKGHEGRTLIKADVEYPDMMVLAYSAVGSGIKGNSTEIEVVDRLGNVTAKTTMNAIADDISVNGERIALAFGKNVYILDEELNEIKKLEAETGVKRMAFFSDSKHVFVVGRSGGQIIE